jgi:hypothetical protein
VIKSKKEGKGKGEKTKGEGEGEGEGEDKGKGETEGETEDKGETSRLETPQTQVLAEMSNGVSGLNIDASLPVLAPPPPLTSAFAPKRKRSQMLVEFPSLSDPLYADALPSSSPTRKLSKGDRDTVRPSSDSFDLLLGGEGLWDN